ncbi:MAG: response regulator [Terracidiphilus sp.]
MTTEPTIPQPELGSAQANGQGQSQGHRRRRRRRKNKSNQPGGQPQGQIQQNQPQPAQPQMQAPLQPQQQAGPPKQGSGRHRKKKKFFQQKANTPQPQPGNSIAPQHNGRRKERQRGPRTFVGPMDHSYRTVNGNVADGPPSTIPTAGNGHHGYYNDVNAGSPAVPVKAGAPTRIFCFIDDLFFQAKIQETAKKLGVKVEFVKGEKETVSRIIDAPEAEKPTLVVFDLNNLNAKPMTLIPKFKTKFKKATSIIGFLNHLQGDLKMKAIEAGCDTVMPRSAFSQSLPNLLRRYGLEEEDEYVPQPI